MRWLFLAMSLFLFIVKLKKATNIIQKKEAAQRLPQFKYYRRLLFF